MPASTPTPYAAFLRDMTVRNVNTTRNVFALMERKQT
jgi:hypothetical protein